jgi:hypothetical protein
MNAPLIHGLPRRVSASDLLDALANDLSEIRRIDKMTWVELGQVLGRSDDQAAKYADGTATMDWVSYKRGELAWGTRFTGSVDRLLEKSAHTVNAHQAQSCVLRAALALAEALEDGELTVPEIRDNRAVLEKAKEAIEGQLGRLGPNAGSVA